MKNFIIGTIIFTTSLTGVLAQKNISQHQINEALSSIMEDYSLDRADISDYIVTDSYTREQTGITHVYLNQTANNYEIFNAQLQLHFNPNNELVFHNSKFIKNKSQKINHENSSIDVNQAFILALEKVDAALVIENLKNDFKESSENTFTLTDNENFLYPVRSTIGYENTEDELVLVYQFIIELKTPSEMYNVKVDANTGEIMNVTNLLVSCEFDHDHNNYHNNVNTLQLKNQSIVNDNIAPKSDGAVYNAYPLGVESPIHGDRILLNNAAFAAASPYGWHDINADETVDYTITRGNNVYAYEDMNNSNSPGYSPDAGGALEFNYPYDINGEPLDNMDASLTNLFVWNNYLHDLSYFYGFDEVSGNFQQNNYGNGGAQNDFVVAEGLDGGGTNNANFYTPQDGLNPRMQMYLWYQLTGDLLTINSPVDISGGYEVGAASFGPDLPDSPITADLVLVASNDDQPSEGCSTLQNANEINGKIAVADRGSCFFYEKALNAQEAGAIALIIINNQTGGTVTMGGDDGGAVNIPVVSVSLADGNIIKAKMSDETVNASIGGTIQEQVFDSNFDNGIIAHEYGHGISNRLTGGPSEVYCLWNDEQMGEGWSDFYSLISSDLPGSSADQPRGIGNFASGRPKNATGIRPFPYTRDMDINPLTYENINQLSIPHGVGSVWCTMLWDLYWDLVDVYGNSYDLFQTNGGNNIANFLVMEGMRIQACNPGFVDGRDAILAADQYLYNGAHQCIIWKTFARRGLGYSASQGSSDIVGDETEAFDMPPSCTDPELNANFSASKTEICTYEVITYEPELVSSSLQYEWTFEGGVPETSTAISPNVFYTEPGEYNVALSVTNEETAQVIYGNYIEVSEGPSFEIELSHEIDEQANGSAEIIVLDGIAPFNFSWNEFPSVDTNNISNLSEGTYTVTVSDGFNCSTEQTFNINSTLGIDQFNTNDFNIYPNPALDNLTIENEKNITITNIKIIDPTGKIIDSKQINNTSSTIFVGGLSKGIYFLEINTSHHSGKIRFVKH